MRIGIIGSGAIVYRFARALEGNGVAGIHAVYSRSMAKAQKLAEDFGAEHAFDSITDLVSCDDIDAVYIASPNACHAGQALCALEHGKHVLVEKPFAATEAQAAAVFEAARARGLVAMEAMRNLHGPAFAAIKRELAQLGDPVSSTLRFAKVSPRAALLDEGELTNVFDPMMAGGALMDIGIYPVALMCALWGRPDAVAAHGLVRDVSALTGDKTCGAIDLAGDALCSYAGHSCHLGWGKVINDYAESQISCSEGSLLFDAVEQPTRLRIMTPVDEHADYGTGAGAARDVELEQLGYNMIWEVEDFAAGDPGLIAWAQEVTLAELAVTDEIRRQLGVVFPQD